MIVLTTTFNCEKYIDKCLTSIMSQTFKDFKCYITDDMSNDNTKEIIKNKIKNDERFILVENTTKRFQPGNYDYVIRELNIDDDDTIDVNYVSTLSEKYLEKDFVVWRMKYQNGLVLPPQKIKDFIFGRVGISFCYKNKFDNLLFDNNRDGEDFDFLSKLKKLTSNWVITPEVYYNVRH